MSESNSNRLRLRSNDVILAKNEELRMNGEPFCEGTYLSHTRGNNSHRHLKACDITDSGQGERERSTPSEILDDIKNYSTNNDHPQCQKQIRYEKAQAKKRNYCDNANLRAVVEKLRELVGIDMCSSINAIYEEEKRYWTEDKEICIDDNIEEYEGNLLNRIESLRNATKDECEEISGKWVRGHKSFLDDSHYCLKNRSSGYSLEGPPYDKNLFDPQISDREECATRYPNGHWCGICTNKPHILPCEGINTSEECGINDNCEWNQNLTWDGDSTLDVFIDNTQDALSREPGVVGEMANAAGIANPSSGLEQGEWTRGIGKCQQKVSGSIDSLYPGVGCVYNEGGIRGEVVKLAAGFTCKDLDALEDAIYTGAGAGASAAAECASGLSWDISSAFGLGDAVNCIADVPGEAIEAAAAACGLDNHGVTGQISHLLTCSKAAQMTVDVTSAVGSFIPVVGPIIGLVGTVGGNAIGQCSKQTQEIIDLQGTCPNAYRDCPNYLYCIPGSEPLIHRFDGEPFINPRYRPGCSEKNKYYPCDPRIDIDLELEDSTYRETYKCDDYHEGYNTEEAFNWNPDGEARAAGEDNPSLDYTRWHPETPVKIEECGEFATRGREEESRDVFAEDKCRACTPIANTKGLKPGDYGRADISGASTSIAPDAYAEIDDENLDTFNNYFCIDDQATRVFRPPPAALIASMHEADPWNKEVESALGSVVEEVDETIDEMTEGDWGCNTWHYSGNMAEAVLNMGDGQGFDKNTCGLREVTYTDINPCNEGYRIAGPTHLNPFSNYDNNPCIYLNKDECNNEHSDNHLCAWKVDEGITEEEDIIECKAKDKNNEIHKRLCGEIIGDSLLSPNECEFVTDGTNLDEPICYYDPKGYCDLEESQFESNYCCKSVPGSEECPFAPIDAWSKFNFASIRDGVKLFDNNNNDLNLNMIQTSDTCGYEGNPTNPVYCHHNPVGEPIKVIDDINNIKGPVPEGDIITPSHPGGFYMDNVFQYQPTEEESSTDRIGPSGTRFILEGSIASQEGESSVLPTHEWKQPPATSSAEWDDGPLNYTKEDLNHKFCRSTKTKKQRNSFEEELNAYTTARIYCPNFNPPDPKTSNSDPYLISALPCLNSNNWATLKYYSRTTKGYNICDLEENQNQVKCSAMTDTDETGLSECIWKDGQCKKDSDKHLLIYTGEGDKLDDIQKTNIQKWLRKSGWHKDEYLNDGISLGSALKLIKEQPEANGTECESNPQSEVSIPSDNNWRPLSPKPGCYYLQNNSPESHNVYKTWQSEHYATMKPEQVLKGGKLTCRYEDTQPEGDGIEEEEKECSGGDPSRIPLNWTKGQIEMGVCDIKTVMDLYDSEDRVFYRKDPNKLEEGEDPNDMSDICCLPGETDGCKESDYDKKCLDPVNNKWIYKTFLDPKSRSDSVNDILSPKCVEISQVNCSENTDENQCNSNPICNWNTSTNTCGSTNLCNVKDTEDSSECESIVDSSGKNICKYINDVEENEDLFTYTLRKKLEEPLWDVPEYSYQINDEKNCNDNYAYWDNEHQKCYEIYKTESSMGGYGEDISECGNNGKSVIHNDHCVKVNMNKSDCLLSGGEWTPTIDTGDTSYPDVDSTLDAGVSAVINRLRQNMKDLPTQIKGMNDLLTTLAAAEEAAEAPAEEENAVFTGDSPEIKEYKTCVKAIGASSRIDEITSKVIYNFEGSKVAPVIESISGGTEVNYNLLINFTLAVVPIVSVIVMMFMPNLKGTTILSILLIILTLLQIFTPKDIEEFLIKHFPENSDNISKVMDFGSITQLILYIIIIILVYDFSSDLVAVGARTFKKTYRKYKSRKSSRKSPLNDGLL